MKWLISIWNYIKTPEHFIVWVTKTFPALTGAKYLGLVYYIGLSIIALVLLYILIKVFLWVFRKLLKVYLRVKAFFLKKKKKKLPEDAAPSMWSRLHKWWKNFKEKLNPEKEPIEEAFYEAAQVLKRGFGGHDSVYNLPWYLVVGDSDSGKTSLLEHLDIKKPFGLAATADAPKLPLSFSFFDYGVMLDVKGRVFYKEQHKAATSKAWQDILTQLNYHRGRRPLDGVVVTVSLEDLYGPKRCSVLEMRNKAQVLYQKLVMLQSNLSMRVPVYVLVTKLDKVPGFDAVVDTLNESILKNIFGWSVPHSMQQHYSPSWMENAKQEVQASLNNLKLQMFSMQARTENPADVDSIFVFSKEFAEIWENLSAFCNQLFSDSLYKDSHFFRGVYFTGALPKKKDYTADLQLFVQQKLDLYFARDLFVEKIFKEKNIAVPSYEIVRSAWQNLTKSKIALLGGLGASCIFSWVAYHQFLTSKARLSPAIGGIKTVMLEVKNARAQGVELSKDELDVYTKHFDHFLKTVTEDTKFWATFMPPSWFAGFKQNAYEALGSAFDLILVQSVHKKVQAKLNKILMPPKEVTKFTEQEKTVFDVVSQKISEKANPAQTEYFKTLEEFTSSLVLLEKIANAYNNFFITRKKDDLFVLMKDLFKYDFNDQFKRNFDLYNWSIRTEAYEKLDLKPYQTKIQQNFETLFDNFITYGVKENDTLKKVFGLNALLDELTDVEAYGNVSLEDFKNIFKTIQDVVDSSYRTGNLAWIAEKKFNPGGKYTNFLTALDRSKLLDKDSLKTLKSRLQDEYSQLKEEVSGSYSTLLSASVFNLKAGSLVANKELIEIKTFLDRFLDEVFMTKVEKKGLSTKELPGKLILWDARHLANAEKMLSNYYDFMEKGIEDYPEKLRSLLERVAKQQLHENLLNLLGAAQYTVSSSVETLGTNPEERFKTQVRSFRASWASLKKILSELSSVDEIPDTVSDLNRFVVDQFIKILVVLDQILDKESLLRVRGGNFKWWSGDDNPALLGFRVSDFKALEVHLDTHFRRLNKLSKDYAKPSVNILNADFLPLRTDEKALVKKWSGILEQSLAYEKKQSGNSVSKLIHLYLSGLKDFSLSAAKKTFKKLLANKDTSDFFLEERINTVKALSNRVDVIGGYKLLAHYNKIVGYFNENIAGRFPFAEDTQEQAEVDLPTLKKLFALMQEKTYEFSDYEVAFKRREQASERYIGFYKKLDTLRQVFAPFIKGEADSPTLGLQIHFHADLSRESTNARFLEDQDFDFGGGDVFGITSDGKKTVWTYGDPVNITFKLASGAGLEMFNYSQEETHYNRINGLEGVFSYEGAWSLFRFLADKADTREKSTLQFNLPVQTDSGVSSLRTFIKVVCSSTDDKNSIVLGGFPAFPSSAPQLSERNLQAIDALNPSDLETDSGDQDEEE